MKNIKTILFGAAVVAAFAPSRNLEADNLAEAAAKASALVNRPIAASPHALEEFPWLLRGYPPPVVARYGPQRRGTYPDNFGGTATEASALVNRPIAASPHALEEFPWLLRGYPPPAVIRQQSRNSATYPDNLAEAAAKASASVNRSVPASPHALEEFPRLLRGSLPQSEPTGPHWTNLVRQ